MEHKPASTIVGGMTPRELLNMWPVIVAAIVLGAAISLMV
jgi:hypothetical protein